MEITFDTEVIRLITLFENITGAPVKDCLVDNKLVYFVIEEGNAGLAIGKNGENVRHVEKMIKRNIKVFEFSNDLTTFVRNLIPQAMEIKIINEMENTRIEVKVDKNIKAVIIGRDGKNIKPIRELLKRNCTIGELILR